MIVVRVVVRVLLIVLVEVVRWGGTIEFAAASFIAIFIVIVTGEVKPIGS